MDLADFPAAHLASDGRERSLHAGRKVSEIVELLSEHVPLATLTALEA